VIGLNGWWELIAIVIGLVCLAIELFVTPGVGIFGVVGFVMVFAGLLGTFVSAGSGLSDPQTQRDLMRGAVTVILAFFTAGIGWWLILKNAHNLPIFDKFILSGASGVGGMPTKSMLHAIIADDGSVKVGSEGITTTPLIPIGQAEFGDELCDEHAAFGSIDRGQRVRVVSATRMRIEVEPINDEHDRETA
jgi:membrane-bound serine protease (ClpP class)